MTRMGLRIGHLYPDLMNLYGDRGNLLVLQKRCEWRGIDCAIEEIGLGDELSPGFDVLFLGGGQDREQLLIHEDLLTRKEPLGNMVDDGLVMLTICGGYQLLGHRFLTYEGELIEGLGLLDVTTVGGEKRLIGNVMAQADIGGERKSLIGFENHSGRTTLGPRAKPLATVEYGYGNNGEDGTEGARQDNIFGTYLHGSLLPKNPWLADLLLETALTRKYDHKVELESLDDSMEKDARAAVSARIRAGRRRRWVPELFKR